MASARPRSSMRMTSGRKFWNVRIVLQIDQGQTCGHQGNQDQGNLQIRVRHHGIPVLFEIEPLGVFETCIVLHPNTLSRSTADDPPAVPLKI